MIKKLKCFFFGHNWNFVAVKCMEYYEYFSHPPVEVETHIHYICSRCEKRRKDILEGDLTNVPIEDLVNL